MKTKTRVIAARFRVGQEARVVSRTHGELVVTVVGVLQGIDGTCYDVRLPEGSVRTVGERFLSEA